MKGCIIKNDQIGIKNIVNCIQNVEKYNWLISNMECYPVDEQIAKAFENEYCWISGTNLLQLLDKEDFQWIWGVFSAFKSDINLSEVLKFELPFADGYTGFWNNPISLQHPLAIHEIVAWDGELMLAMSQQNGTIEYIMENCYGANDLAEYNIAYFM